MNYKLSAVLISDEGLKRAGNEDNYCLFGLCRENTDQNKTRLTRQASSECAYLAVYDGMGGEEAGEIASLIAAQNIKPAKISDGDKVGLDSIIDANNKIAVKASEYSSKCIGTTMAGLFFEGDRAVSCNVGDSRCYLFRDDKLIQLSRDHSEGQRLIEMGMDPDKVKRTSAWHQLTQHLGIPSDEFLIEPYYSNVLILKPDDIFLLCSDGLTDMVEDHQIEKILSHNTPLNTKADALLSAALKNGGEDNTTVLLVHIDELTGPIEDKVEALPPPEISFWGKIVNALK